MRQTLKALSRRLVSALLAALCVISLLPAALAAAPEGMEAGLDGYIDAHSSELAGLAAAVFDSDGIIYERYAGFADLEAGIEVDADTVFEWGSVTKLLVWVSVMQLCERGELSLDADVRGYLPEGFLKNLRYDEPVTMLHLMDHNAGFQEMAVDLFTPEGSEVVPLEEFMRTHQPEQVYAPGAVTAYSNWGAALAGLIVERVSGESFADYVRHNIFEPLGMRDTALLPDLSDAPAVAHKRRELKCYGADLRPLGTDINQIDMYPAGMCTGTLADFCAFGRALLDEDSPLFSDGAARELLFSPSLEYEDGSPRCCHGFWVLPRAELCVGHGGNTDGCSAELEIDLERGLGIVVMTNRQGESVFCDRLPKLVFGEYAPAEGEGALRPGLYRSARTVLSGPLKLYSLLTVASFDASDAVESAAHPRSDGAICAPYGDYLPIGGAQIAEYILVLILLLGMLFSAGYLAVRLVSAIVRRIKRKSLTDDRMRRLRTEAAALLLIFAALIAAAFVLVLGWTPSRGYVWIFVLAGVLALVMAALCALMLRGIKIEERRGARALDILFAVFLAVGAANIVYWQIYRFWAI